MLFPGQGDRVILPAHSTRASFHKKKIDPFARANSGCAVVRDLIVSPDSPWQIWRGLVS